MSFALVRVGDPTAGPDVRSYLERVRSFPRLAPEVESDLARRYQAGDKNAGRRLIECSLRLVLQVAAQYRARAHQVLDVIQEGNVGLMQALKKYEPSRGVPFSAYARYWIRARVLRYLSEHHGLVNTVNTRAGRRVFFNLNKARRQIEASGAQATVPELARRLGVDEHEVRQVVAHLDRPVSLDAPGPDGRTWVEVVPHRQDTPEKQVARRKLRNVVRSCMEAFQESLADEREQVIWEERLTAEDPASLSTLGKRFGVSKERVRQLEARMKGRIERLLLDEVGPDLDYEFFTPAEG